MRNHLILSVACCTLLGCASVSSVPLATDGLHVYDGAAEGFRYYLPKPYLLVTYVPAPPAALPKRNAKNSKPDGAPGPSSGDGGIGNSGGGSPPTASDVGFQAQSPTYMIKLIYLPDYDHPSAVKMNPGAGSSSMQLTFQDGWMLTNVSTAADNSATMTMLTSVIQALAGIATGGASSAAKAGAAAVPPGGPGQVLKPGLYAFDYSGGDGRVTSICAVSYFDSNGAHAPSGKDPDSCAAIHPRTSSK